MSSHSISSIKVKRCNDPWGLDSIKLTTMPKDNLLFKLDNLEYQYHQINGTLNHFQPRLNSTSKIYNAKSKKTSKKISKLLSETSLTELRKDLNALRKEIFNKKVYYLDKHLRSFLLKQILQYRPSKKSKNDFTVTINLVKEKYGLEKFVELISKSKVIKLSLVKLCPSKHASPPDWFLDHPFWKIHEDKTQEFNPSRVWNEILLKTEGSNQLVSTLMNNEKCKELVSGFNSGMDTLLAINREKRQKKDELKPENSPISESESEGDTEVQVDRDSPQDDGNADEIDEDYLKQYDGLLVASDDENEENPEDFALDPNVNYNEITDEEPDLVDGDEQEDLGEENEDIMSARKKQKVSLPELMGGYYSGEDSDSGSDPAEDRVAREQISLKEKKKNRRGQRARRKIWEKKYGREAKHIQREVEKDMEERKKRQREYEERVAKRAARAVDIENDQREPEGEKKKSHTPPLQPDHPSWVAKRNAEEKQKNTKFTGKKIKFD